MVLWDADEPIGRVLQGIISHVYIASLNFLLPFLLIAAESHSLLLMQTCQTGDTENCGEYVNDWMTCFKAKTKRDPIERETLLNSMSIVQKYVTGNSILPAKEVPGWK